MQNLYTFEIENNDGKKYLKEISAWTLEDAEFKLEKMFLPDAKAYDLDEVVEDCIGESLDDIKAGDKVLLHSYSNAWSEKTVTKATATTIFISDQKFNREGQVKGGDSPYVWIRQYDKRIISRAREEKKSQNELYQLIGVNWKDVPAEKRKEAYKALSELGIFL